MRAERSGVRGSALSDAQVEAGFLYVLAVARGLEADAPARPTPDAPARAVPGATPSAALAGPPPGGDAGFPDPTREEAAALAGPPPGGDAGFPDPTPEEAAALAALPVSARPRAAALVRAGAALVAGDPTVTLSVAEHDRVRHDVLARAGRTSTRGAVSWPAGSRTVSARLGAGSWSAALARLGLAVPTAAPPAGNRRFTGEDFVAAMRAFRADCEAGGTPATFSAYGSWARRERSGGRAVPVGATLRQHFGSWSRALERAERP